MLFRSLVRNQVDLQTVATAELIDQRRRHCFAVVFCFVSVVRIALFRVRVNGMPSFGETNGSIDRRGYENA